MSTYANGRVAQVGERVIGNYGSQVVTGILTEVEPKAKIQAQDSGRSVYLDIDLGSFFLAQDALSAAKSIVAKNAPPLAPVQAAQPIAVVQQAPPAPKPAEPLPGWPA